MATKKNFKSYENCCRTCMNEDSIMFDIFINSLNSPNLADILTSCTRLNVQKEDALPKKMCNLCHKCLISFYNFREVAEKVDSKLREIALNDERKCCSNVEIDNDIKLDIKNEQDTDADYFEIFEPKLEMKEEVNTAVAADENKITENYRPKRKCREKVEKKKYSCAHCSKTFGKPSRLKYHLERHTKCNKKNSAKYASPLINNENININSKIQEQLVDISGQIQCSVCPSMFKSVNSLSAHMRKHTEKGRVIACGKCGKVFKKISHLKRHEKTHDESRQHKCSLCPRSFQSEESLKGHMNRHNGIKPHSCPLCPKSFAHLTTLTTHIKIHQRDKFLCPTCGKKFDSSTNLDQHMRRHLGLKQFACTMCPRKFVSKGELKSHTVTHTGEKSHTCDQCGSSFTKQTSLAKHKLRHLGIKPYQCETCSMKFSCSDHLKRHHRIHTGEKPYKCEICERAFTQSNDLIKHRRAHLGDKIYKCTECSESFRLHVELRQHLSEHFISSQLKALKEKEEKLLNNVKPTDGVSDVTEK